MTKSRHILLPRRPWTRSERAELRRRYKTESAAEIAIAMGRSPSAVYQQTQKLGLRKSLAVVAQMARERSARLGFTVSEEFLARLGFAATRIQSAKCYHEIDWRSICAQISRHVLAAADGAKEAA